MRLSLCLWLLGCRLAFAGSATPPPDTSQFLETVRKKYEFPGLAVIVIKDGRTVDLAAAGLRKKGAAALLTTNDLFHIGSCTKSMTATLAAMFIEQGALRWDSTIGDVFPELLGSMNSEYRQVTLWQLLTHRGGVPGSPPPDAWKQAWQDHGPARQQRYEFMKAVLRNPPEAAPGTKFIYSNQGYAIAGAMLEKITNTPWEELMRQKLFKPLGMLSAGFGPPGTTGGLDQPWGHHREGNEIVALQSDNPSAIGPAGTVHCSLPDLAKYAELHLRGQQSSPLLKPESFRKLHTPPEGADYAAGWGCYPRPWANGVALNHNGSNTMWYLVMWLAPARDFAVIVATNTGAGDTGKGCDDVAAAMIRKWLGPPAPR